MSEPTKRWFQKSTGYIIAGVSAAATSVLIYAGMQLLFSKKIQPTLLDNPVSAENPPQSESGLAQLKQTSESFRTVAKMVGPAVVNIKSTRGVKKKMGPRILKRPRQQQQDEEEESPLFRDPFFEFFERFGQPFPFTEESPQESLGSGIIIDKKGYIVTNNHVIEAASKILVILSGDRPSDLKARIIGTDPKTDLAVLKVENGKDLPTAEWADSDKVEVGDWAVAIGSPFALGQSVTVGIVSATKGRSAKLTGAEYGELIQTDAAINPGNSGGPLCGLDGKVMGVNTAIYTRSGGYMGIGFAIPSNLAKEIVGKLIASGKVVRGWLGVLIQPVDEEFAKRLEKLGIKGGVSVHEVMGDSPAAKAGLKAGDVIVEVEGTAIKDVTQLQRMIINFKPSQRVRLKALSFDDKKPRNIDVKIGELPTEEKPLPRAVREDEAPDDMGAIVSPGPGGRGVVIEYIEKGSPADQGGLEVADTILRINGQAVNSVSAYKKQIGPSRTLGVLVRRKVGKGDKPRETEKFFPIKIP